MMTLFMVFAAVALVVLAGEAVRGQCRRMLDRPVPLVSANDVALDAQPVTAVAA
jgi:hypothetical protein